MGDPQNDDMNEKIRNKAYEIWEQEGREGDPQDHWLRAERELAEQSRDPLGTTNADVPPAEAVRAVEATDPMSAGLQEGSGEGGPSPSRATNSKRRR
jgi:hypothetical protein